MMEYRETIIKLEPLDAEVIHESTTMVEVLKEFIDIVPPELSKTILLYKCMDHNIKLESSVKPLTRLLYLMTPPKSVELRKQLDELISSSLICNSKTLFRALIFFSKRIKMRDSNYA